MHDCGCNFGRHGADHGALERHDRAVDHGVILVVTILGLLSDVHRRSLARDFGEPLGKVELSQLWLLALMKSHRTVACRFYVEFVAVIVFAGKENGPITCETGKYTVGLVSSGQLRAFI